jgi:integrase
MEVNRLTVSEIKGAVPGAMLYDGNGLYFRASGPGRGSWEWRYYRFGVEHRMGLRSYRQVSLAAAREEVRAQQQILVSGRDPIKERKTQRILIREQEALDKTFRETGEDWRSRQKWKGKSTIYNKKLWLNNYIYPVIGDLPIRVINTNHVLGILEPIWEIKGPTAEQVRIILSDILAYATVREYRTGNNPAEWEGHLEALLDRYSPDQDAEHQPALPYKDVGDFMMELRDEQESAVTAALEFTILMATRPKETTGARWCEFDFPNKVWVIPAARMKNRMDHSIPLFDAALAVLDRRRRASDSEFVFPGEMARTRATHINSMSMTARLRFMKHEHITVHGFRSTFRTWIAECTDYSPELGEVALAHTTEAAKKAKVTPQLWKAYIRGEFLEKRRPMMEDWAKFVMTPSANLEVHMADSELAEAAD